MTAGTLQQTIKDYRAQLALEEQQAVQALEHAYAATLQAIQPMLEHLYQQIDDAQATGEELSPSWLYERNRLETLTRYIEGQIDQFGMLAQMQTGQLQYSGTQLGTQAAQQLLQSTVPPGVSWSFGIPAPQAISNLVGATQKGSPLYDLFHGFGAEAAQGAKNALINGLSLGQNPRDIARGVQDALDVPRWRALTIARTEELRAYRGANSETFRANGDVVDGWIWQAALDRDTCAACVAMNGQEFSLDQDMDTHVNCRCVQVPKTKGWDSILSPLGIDTSDIPDTSVEIESGADWFDRQSEDMQRAILGNAKYEAFADGKFTLQDVVGKSFDKDWGGSIYERSLKDTLEAASKAPVQEVQKLSAEEQRIKALEDKMSAKYPDTVFNFAGADPVAMEASMKQLDTLFRQYPEVAKSVPYVGTGDALPEKLAKMGFTKALLTKDTFAAVMRITGSTEALSPLFFNTAFYSDAADLKARIAHLGEIGWFASGAGTGGIEYIVSHEFGHILNNYIDAEGHGMSFMGFINRTGYEGEVATTLQRWMSDHQEWGNRVSEYAKTNRQEAFAEAFASLQFASVGEQAAYTRILGQLLDDLIPDGSIDNWMSVEPDKWSEENFNAWLAFQEKYRSLDEEVIAQEFGTRKKKRS